MSDQKRKVVVGQGSTGQEIHNVFSIFKTSEAQIRPHFFLTGPSGSGKTLLINTLCKRFKMNCVEINAASLTKEGTSGNSLSKALSSFLNMGSTPTVCFVDEFDKLFISGNQNSDLAHETTHGVQNEFLKVLEARTASVFGDYGKYIDVSVENVLFVFAGAFNNEAEVTVDKLRRFGVKTEFLGRVGLVFNTSELSLEDLIQILKDSPLLTSYLELFSNANRKTVIAEISKYMEENFEHNTIGARIINTLLHQYFINGSLKKETVEKSTFQNKLELPKSDE